MVSIDFRNIVAPKSLTLWQAQLEAVHMIFVVIIIDQFLFFGFWFWPLANEFVNTSNSRLGVGVRAENAMGKGTRMERDRERGKCYDDDEC